MKVCVITGSRADYGLLQPIMNALKRDKFFDFKLIVTGNHLMEKFGSTYRMIINDGFIPDHYITMNLESDKPKDIIHNMGNELTEFGKIFNEMQPDLVLVLGDRYEILIPVVACLIYKIRVGHFCGGNITEGAYDDKIRHAITKMSTIHFVTDSESEKIVRQMGENNVIVCGNPGLEEFFYFTPIKINIKLYKKNMMVIYHPETLNDNTEYCAKKLREAIENYDGHKFIFRPNADNDNNIINNILQGVSNATYILSLERNIYLSLAYHCNIFIGNSSSGIFEIPLLNGPIIINIGKRQKGRKLASNIIDCPDYEKISECITLAETLKGPFDFYYKPMNTSDIVINFLKKL